MSWGLVSIGMPFDIWSDGFSRKALREVANGLPPGIHLAEPDMDRPHVVAMYCTARLAPFVGRFLLEGCQGHPELAPLLNAPVIIPFRNAS